MLRNEVAELLLLGPVLCYEMIFKMIGLERVRLSALKL